MKHLRRCLPLFALLLMLAGSIMSCRDVGVRDALQRAEALMETDPHAARAVLMEIEDGRLKAATQREQNGAGSDSAEREQARPKVKIEDYPTAEGNKTDRDTTNQPPVDSQRKGKKANFQFSIFNFQSKRDAALYALLRTQADYKCDVPLTTDSLARIATDYYGTPRRPDYHAAMAWYTLGCVYKEMSDDVNGTDAFLKAKSLFPDTLIRYYALTETNLGLHYMNRSMKKEAIKEFQCAKQNLVRLSDSTSVAFLDLKIAECHIYSEDYCTAKTYLDNIIANSFASNQIIGDTYFELAKVEAYQNHRYEKAQEYLDYKIIHTSNKKRLPGSYSMKGDIFQEQGQFDSAWHFYNRSLSCRPEIATFAYVYFQKASLASRVGKTDSIQAYIQLHDHYIDSLYAISNQQAIRLVMNDHRVEMEQQRLKARHSQFMLWMGIVLVAVVAGAVVFLLQADRRRKKHNLQLQEELRQANVALLQAQNEEQPADMDALYRNKLAACQNLFRSTPSARLLLTAPDALTSAQRQTLLDDLTRSFVDIMMDIRNAAHAVNDQELLYCILTSLQSPTTYIAALLNTTDSTLRTRKSRLKEKMPESLFALFFS